MPKPLITIAIPTFDKPKLLKIAIESCLAQPDSKLLEIIVIDNHPQQTARLVAQKHQTTYFHEPKIGHSYAKNKGLFEANGEYIIFLDDDARLTQNWLKITQKIIAQKKPVVFGGPIMPYFQHAPPKWFKPAYESRAFGNQSGFLKPNEHLPTSSTLINTKSLREIGGFNESYGIKGGKRRFGEDTDVLRRLKKKYITKIYYDPKLIVEHFTPSQKTTLKHRFIHLFNLGASDFAVSGDEIATGKLIVKSILSIIMMLIHTTLIPFRIRTKQYPHFQNYLYEAVAPDIYWLGRLYNRCKKS